MPKPVMTVDDLLEDFGYKIVNNPELKRTELCRLAGWVDASSSTAYGMRWCDYEHYQEELDDEGKELNRKPRQLSSFNWIKI